MVELLQAHQGRPDTTGEPARGGDGTHGTGGRHVEEVRLWASLRSRTLARCVRGLSQYEDAATAGELEAPEATEEARLALVRRKCQLVVRVSMATKEGDAKADDVETLLARFPCPTSPTSRWSRTDAPRLMGRRRRRK